MHQMDGLVDYFVVCGLDEQHGLELLDNAGGDSSKPPLDRSYKANYIEHHPPAIDGNPLDKEAVRMLCLPSGLTFMTSVDSLAASYHSFIITHNDGSREFGYALTFYEKIKNMDILIAMKALYTMYHADLTCTALHNSSDNNNIAGKVIGHRRKLSALQINHSDIDLPSRWHDTFDMEVDDLYVSKCIALITSFQHVEGYRKIVEELFTGLFIGASDECLPLETYIYHLLYEVPAPRIGQYVRLHLCTGLPLIIKNPNGEMPVFEYSLREFFRLLGTQNAIDVFNCLLLEGQILLLSSDYYRLMLVAEALSVLLFPFTWPHTYVPILPSLLKSFLEAPFPFLMGIQYRNQDDKSQLGLPCEASVCFVDIDSGTIDLPQDLLDMPYKKLMAEEIDRFLEEYNAKLPDACLLKYSSSSVFSKVLQDNVQFSCYGSPDKNNEHVQFVDDNHTSLQRSKKKEVGVTNESNRYSRDNWLSVLEKIERERRQESARVSLEEQCNASLRGLFLNFFVKLLAGFESYLASAELSKTGSTEYNFDKYAFLAIKDKKYQPFYASFLESQMFATFIESKCFTNVRDSSCITFMKKMKEHRKDALAISSVVDVPLADSPTEAELSVGIGETCKSATCQGHVVAGRGLIRQLNGIVLNSGPFRTCTRKVELPFLRSGGDEQSSVISPWFNQSKGANNQITEKLLKEIKCRTNRLFLAKVEPVETSLGVPSIKAEATMITALTELLERVFKHEVMSKLKKGQSSIIWTYLKRYKDAMPSARSRAATIATSARDENNFNDYSVVNRKSKLGHVEFGSIAEKLKKCSNLLEDIKYDSYFVFCIQIDEDIDVWFLPHLTSTVTKIEDVKTDSGFTTAFIRLSLEKKCLSQHFRELICTCDFVRENYKDNAFIVGEEERDQFLTHLLSLQTVDFYCFTDHYKSFSHTYRLIITGKQAHQQTKAKFWLIIIGSHWSSCMIDIPECEYAFEIQNQNLGRLIKLRIEHDSSGVTPGWYLEAVIVQDVTTLQVYRFIYNRRILACEEAEAEKVTFETIADAKPLSLSKQGIVDENNQEIVKENITKLRIAIEQIMQQPSAVERISCGENGLCSVIESILMNGHKNSRQPYRTFSCKDIWGYFEKAARFSMSSQDGKYGCKRFTDSIDVINGNQQNTGNDIKFQRIICTGVREKLLSDWILLLHKNCVTMVLYEKNSIIRNQNAIHQITHELDKLKKCNMN